MNKNSSNARNLVGIGLIVLGVIFLLDALEVFGADTNLFGKLWPLLMIGVGIWMWAQSGFTASLGPIIAVTLGVFLLVGSLTDENVWRFWPVLLIIVGLWFIWSRGRAGHQPVQGNMALTPLEGAVNISAFLGGNNQRMSGEFHGGRVTAIMGSVSMDLLDTTLPPGGAVLDVNVLMGGLDLKTPDTWKIDFRASVLLGELEDKRRQPPNPFDATSPMLTVRGSVLMGGLTVKS